MSLTASAECSNASMYLPVVLVSRNVFGPVSLLYYVRNKTYYYYYSFVSCLDYLLRYSTGFTTDRPCGFWCRGLPTCFLYIGPLFGNQVWSDSGFVSLTQWRTTFSLFLITFYIHLNASRYDNTLVSFTLFHFSNSVLFLYSTLILTFYIAVDLTLSFSIILSPNQN